MLISWEIGKGTNDKKQKIKKRQSWGVVIKDQLEVFKWCLSSVEIGWSYQPLNNYNVYYAEKKKKYKFLLEYFCFWNVGSFRYKKTRTILYSSRLNYLRAKCVYFKKKKKREKLIKKLKKQKRKYFNEKWIGLEGVFRLLWSVMAFEWEHLRYLALEKNAQNVPVHDT